MRFFRRKGNKYGNVKTVIDGITFMSKKESDRYADLKLKEKANQIKDLRLQETHVLQASFRDREGKHHRAITYKSDFVYHDNILNLTVIEDTKGFRTIHYQIKKKLLIKSLPEGTIFREI